MDISFLGKVKIKNFAYSAKKWDSRNRRDHRDIYKYANNKSDTVFTVIGSTFLNIGYSTYWGSDEPAQFVMTGRQKVYIVADRLSRRFKVLPEDIELV